MPSTLGIIASSKVFSPSDIPWLRALWASDPAWSAPADGAAIATWRELTGSGADATNGTAANRPTFRASLASFNNRPYAEFDGVNDAIQTPTHTGTSGVVTLVVFGRYRTNTSGAWMVDAASADGVIYNNTSSSGVRWSLFAGSAQNARFVADSLPHLFIAEFPTSGNATLELDGNEIVNANAGTLSSTRLTLGGRGNLAAQFAAVDIAFAGLIDRALTAAERADIRQWATFFYGGATAAESAVLHPIVTGQSLASGTSSTALTTTAYDTAHVLRRNASQFVGVLDLSQEPPEDGMARLYYDLESATNPHRRIVTYTSSLSATAYTGLKKGTATYSAMTSELTSAFALAGPTMKVPALHIIHGHSDIQGGTSRATYLGYLQEWRSDYDGDVKAITGQTDDVIAVFDQCTAWKAYSATAAVPLAQLDAHRLRNGLLFAACPLYHLPLADTVHLTGAGYRHLGEYHARASYAARTTGEFEPVSPRLITIASNVITIKFHVPVAPLVFDTTAIASQTNYGFSYSDDSSSATISSVAITGDDTVQVTLSTTPTGANPKIGYAITGNGLGNLRDSDTFASVHDAAALRNWCLLFQDPVPFDDGTN